MADLYNLYVRISTDSSGFESGVEEAVSKGKDASNRLGAATVAFGNIMANVMTKAGETLVSVAKTGIQYNAQIEKYTTSLTTALGSAEEAASAIEAIKQDAAATPFSVDGLVKANSFLIAAGENATDARETIMALSDAVSASGGGNDELQRMAQNLQQIKNAGQATSMDIKQFAMAGIDVYGILADYTGKSAAEVKDLNISYEMLSNAFVNAASAGGRFYQANLAQSQTLNGQWSTLQDNVQSKMGEAFRGLSDTISSTVLPAANEFVAAFDTEKAVDNIETIAVTIGIVAAGIKAQQFASLITKSLIVPIQEAMVATSLYALENGAAATSQAILSGSMGITGVAAGVLTGKITLAEAAQWGLNAASAAFPGAIIIAALTAVGVAAYNSSKNFKELTASMSEVSDSNADGAITASDYADKLAELNKRKDELVKEGKWNQHNGEMRAVQRAIDEVTEGYDELREAEKAAADDAYYLASAEGHGEGVMERTQVDLKELVAAYNEAYDAIGKSVRGFFGMYEKANEVQSASIDDMIANLNSQVQFNESYAENVATITNSGIEGASELASTFASAGEEGAAYAKAIADAISSGDTDKVSELAAAWESVQKSQDSLTGALAQTTGAFDALVEAADGDISTIEAALQELDGTTVHIFYEGKMSGEHYNGSHATGLDYVPFNGYVAQLHKGERVLTAAENRAYESNGGSGKGTVNNYFYPQSMTSAQMDYMAAAINRQLGGAFA